MSGRPPDGDPLLDRVKEGLRDWYKYHHGYENEKGQAVLNPDLAQGLANGIARELRGAIAANELTDADRRLWARNVARGAELLAEAELHAPLARGAAKDEVEALENIGWRHERDDGFVRGEESKRQVNWFLAGGAIAGVVVYLVMLFSGPDASDVCAWQPDPEAWPDECVVPYTRWLSIMFPYVRYEDEYSFSTHEKQLFEACIPALYSTHGSAFDWGLDVGGRRLAGEPITVPEKVIDACREYDLYGAGEVDWIQRGPNPIVGPTDTGQ